jgi:methyltransferase (TIGR00027 family)
MESDQYGRTALMMAFFRAQHHLHDEPKLFDDPYAHRLLTAAEMAAFTERFVRDGLEMGVAPGEPQAVLARSLREASGAAAVLSRARYTEDRLALAVERGVAQYVLVGAGLDTFAFRRSDIRNRVQVFELDHPQSQALKRERLAAASLVEPPNLHFGTVDFERESVAAALGRLPFRPDGPAVFAWLGVTMYLTRAAIDVTWRAVRHRTLLQCPRRRLQHAEIVRARANHLARLAGDRRIRGECRRSEQRDDTCGHPPQASRPSPMNSAVTPAPATVSRIYFISSSDRPSAPSIERNTAPPVDNSTRAVTS